MQQLPIGEASVKFPSRRLGVVRPRCLNCPEPTKIEDVLVAWLWISYFFGQHRD